MHCSGSCRLHVPCQLQRAETARAPSLTVFDRPQAFKSYDEAGASRRVACLKYLVLAYMLMESEVDPFDAQVRGGFW